MSKALKARLAALERHHEGLELPRPALVAIVDIDGTITAGVPGCGHETFADEGEMEARAAELGLQAILVHVVDGRKGGCHGT